MAYRTARVESRALGARLSETLALPLPSFAGRVAGLLRALLGLSRLLAASIAQFAGRVGFFFLCWRERAGYVSFVAASYVLA